MSRLVTRSGYTPGVAGQWVYPRRSGYKMACCGCGLVHLFKFALRPSWHGPGKKIAFRVWMDTRATAAMRREMRKRGAPHPF